jgi:hypothetical protein
MSEDSDWEEMRELEVQLNKGPSLELTDVVSDLLRRAARQVALADADTLMGLRIVDADRRKSAGDIQGARQILKDVLAVEVVPLYRQVAQTQLDALDE